MSIRVLSFKKAPYLFRNHRRQGSICLALYPGAGGCCDTQTQHITGSPVVAWACRGASAAGHAAPEPAADVAANVAPACYAQMAVLSLAKLFEGLCKAV